MPFEPLTPLENEVYDVLREYLNKNNQFSIKATLPYCYSKLSKEYSQKQIAMTMTSLIQKRYIIQGSSLSREDILSNHVRKEIYKFIQINPGAYNRLIRRELNLGSHEFNWHVGMLEKFNFIKKIQFNRRFGYYQKRSYMDHEYDLFLLQIEKVNDIIRFLDKNEGTVSQISSGIEMHYSTVRKYVKELCDRNLVFEMDIPEKKLTVYKLNHSLLIKIRKIINGQMFVEFAD